MQFVTLLFGLLSWVACAATDSSASDLTARDLSCAFDQTAFKSWIPNLTGPLSALASSCALLGSCTSPAYFNTIWPDFNTHWTSFYNVFYPNQACFGLFYKDVAAYQKAQTELLTNFNLMAASVATIRNTQCVGFTTEQAVSTQKYLVALQNSIAAIRAVV
jgi:hypothetical protein